MKQTTIYLALTIIAQALFTTSCKHGIMQSGITIKGTEIEYNGQTLYSTYENAKKGIVTDTITIKSGKFTIKAESIQETPLYITDENNKLITALFVKNDDEIKISGKLAPYKSKINGTPANTQLGEFYNKNATILSRLDSLHDLYKTRHNDTTYTNQLTETTDSIGNLVSTFVKNNPTSTASIFLIYRYISLYDNRDKTRQLIKNITPAAKPEKFTAKIEKFVSVQRYDKNKVMPYTQLYTPNDSSIYNFTRKNLPTIVYFWSINDTASIRGLDTLRALYKIIPDKKIQIHSISVDINKEAWKKKIREEKLPWNQSILPEGWNSRTAYLLNLNKLPSIFFLERNSTIIGRDLQTDSLRTLINKKIKQ